MSYLRNQMGLLKFDKRLLEINLKSGTITEEEYKQHLTALADDEANSETLKLDADKVQEVKEETMNGDHHPAQPANNDPFGGGIGTQSTDTTTGTPTNNDPFGSGY